MRGSEGCTYPLTNRFEADCVDVSVTFCKVIAYVPNSDNLKIKRDDSTLERKMISFCIYRLSYTHTHSMKRRSKRVRIRTRNILINLPPSDRQRDTTAVEHLIKTEPNKFVIYYLKQT